MARVWQRLGATVFFGVLLVGLWECKGKQKAGDPCTHNNMYLCQDPNSAIICLNGKLADLPCRGPKGCQGTGTNSECDDDVAAAGDPCVMASNGANYACGSDQKSELVCQQNKFTVASTCKGPKGCKIQLNNVECDDDFADIGDPCVQPASDSNYSCTPDKKTMVVCQASKFGVFEQCKGPKGCHIETNTVYCDTTVAAEGDSCKRADAESCTADATYSLKCSPQLKWAKDKACPKEGCKVKNSMIYCK